MINKFIDPICLLIEKANSVPKWYNEPSDNAYADKGETHGQIIEDWLSRHNVQKDGDKYVFYHGTPKINNFSYIRKDS